MFDHIYYSSQEKNCFGNFFDKKLIYYILWIKSLKYFSWQKTILERGRWCHNSNFIERGNHLIRYWCRKKRPHGSGRAIYTETPALWKGIYTETCVILFKKVLKQSLSFAFKNVFLKKLVFCFLKMHFFQRVPVREGVNGKKTFSFGHCPNKGRGVYPCPNFLALFLEVHFW